MLTKKYTQWICITVNENKINQIHWEIKTLSYKNVEYDAQKTTKLNLTRRFYLRGVMLQWSVNQTSKQEAYDWKLI